MAVPKPNQAVGGPTIAWAPLTPDDVAQAQAVQVTTGLDDAEAATRLARWGPNALPREGPASWPTVLRRQVTNFIVVLLMVAAAISFLLGEVADGFAIAAVLVVNTAIGLAMEVRAEREIAALAELAATRARVRREGRVLDLCADQLVPGDVVLLEPGDRVPADGRLVAGPLHADESLLTGESVPVGKVAEALPEAAGQALGDRRNEVFAGAIVTGGTGTMIVVATGVGWAPEGRFLSDGTAVEPGADAGLRALLRAGQRCNDATLERHGGAWHIHGDPSEGALLVVAAKAGLADDRAAVKRMRSLPPGPGRPWMVVVCREATGEVAYLKGAPDQVLARCDRERREDGGLPLEKARRSAWRAAAAELADRPLRVFGLAERPLAPGWRDADLESGWVWLGLAGMADPPRPGADLALSALASAGVRAVMLTGDHPHTAGAIAEALALTPGRAPRVSTDVGGPPADVYARVTPEDKYDLVRALEARGEVVAMTGDGVNDAPALRAATVGVAMGAGVEVAKEAAAAVLLDSRLATLIAGIREGRGAYFNIQKALDYLLTCSVATMLAVLLTTAAGFPLPLAPLQILYLNLLTHSFPALGLALEPAEADRLASGPLPRRAPILTAARLGSIVWHALMIAVVTLAVGAWGLAHESEAHGRTLVFATLASALMLHAFSDRSPRPFGGWRLAGWPFYTLLGTAVALQLAAIYNPWLASTLSLTAMLPDDWLGVAAAACVATAAVEVSKRVLPPDWPGKT